VSNKSASVDTPKSNKRVDHWIVAGAFFTIHITRKQNDQFRQSLRLAESIAL